MRVKTQYEYQCTEPGCTTVESRDVTDWSDNLREVMREVYKCKAHIIGAETLDPDCPGVPW